VTSLHDPGSTMADGFLGENNSERGFESEIRPAGLTAMSGVRYFPEPFTFARMPAFVLGQGPEAMDRPVTFGQRNTSLAKNSVYACSAP
jgi:hypothetical protein